VELDQLLPETSIGSQAYYSHIGNISLGNKLLSQKEREVIQKRIPLDALLAGVQMTGLWGYGPFVLMSALQNIYVSRKAPQSLPSLVDAKWLRNVLRGENGGFEEEKKDADDDPEDEGYQKSLMTLKDYIFK